MNTSIHLRNVDSLTATKLKTEAKAKNISVNSLILQLLQQCLGLNHTQRNIIHHDLDKFAGTWSAEEEKEFLRSIQDFEKIDKELW